LECHHPAAPKMLVKYVKESDSNIADARLLYIEEATPTEAKDYKKVKILEGTVYKTSTRSMKRKDYEELREAMAKRRSSKDKQERRKSKEMEKEKEKETNKDKEKEASPRLEGPLPAKLDPAYDRNHPKYYIQDINQEARDLLEEHHTSNPPVKKTPVKTVQFEGVKIDGNRESKYDIMEDVAKTRANVTIEELLKESALFRKELRPLVTGRKRKFKLPQTHKSPIETSHQVSGSREDLGPPDIDVQVAGCVVR
jgi:hypothetical protein